jgi:hypothetical protein
MNEPTNFNTDGNTEYQDDQAVPVLYCPHSGNDSEWDNPPYSTINAWKWGTKVSKSHSNNCSNNIKLQGCTSVLLNLYWDANAQFAVF